MFVALAHPPPAPPKIEEDSALIARHYDGYDVSLQAQQAGNIFSAGQDYAGRQDQNFNNERARQIQGISLAPTLANQDYVDANAMTAAGDRFGAQDQSQLDAQQKNFLEARAYPLQQLQTLGSAFNTNAGTTSTMNAGSASPWATGLGTASLIKGLK